MTNAYANRVREGREINAQDLEVFMENLHSTGNTFDISYEVVHQGDNPGKKVVITTSDAIGENLTFSQFTSQIMEELIGPEGTGRYELSVGDSVIVNVTNTNRTMGQIIRDFFTPGSGGSGGAINANAVVLITR